jgi:hypothetical protein
MDTRVLFLLLFCALGAPALAGTAIVAAWSWPQRLGWFLGWMLIGWAITVVCVGHWLAVDGFNASVPVRDPISGESSEFDFAQFVVTYNSPLRSASHYIGWIVPMLAFGAGAALGGLVRLGRRTRPQA